MNLSACWKNCGREHMLLIHHTPLIPASEMQTLNLGKTKMAISVEGWMAPYHVRIFWGKNIQLSWKANEQTIVLSVSQPTRLPYLLPNHNTHSSLHGILQFSLIQNLIGATMRNGFQIKVGECYLQRHPSTLWQVSEKGLTASSECISSVLFAIESV